MRQTTRIDRGILYALMAMVSFRRSIRTYLAASVFALLSGLVFAAPWELVESEPSPSAAVASKSEVSLDPFIGSPPPGSVSNEELITDEFDLPEETSEETADLDRTPGVLQTLYETFGIDSWLGEEGERIVEPAGHESFGGLFHPQGYCGKTCCPKWRGSVGALLLWQGNLASRPLYRDFDGDSIGAVALDANELVPAMSAGPRYGILYQINPCWSVEGNYFRATPFETAISVTGNPELAEVDILGFNDPGFDDVTVSGNGEVQSAECNFRHRHCHSPTNWIAGFRWVQLDQNLLIAEEGLLDDPNYFADFLTRSGNDLYGGQIGFDTMVWNDCQGPIQVNVLGKAGVFANIAYQSVSYEDSDGDIAELDASTTATSFFGEFGVNATYRLTSWLGWRVGYTLFWASGVATPVGQLSANNLDTGVARIDMSGSVLLHGATTGVEARW